MGAARKENTMTSSYVPPYISAGEFVKFTNSLRTRRPDPLTVKALQEIGISQSNSYTLFGSLVRMGLYDDEGKLLQREDLVGLSSKDEDIKREAYKRIVSRTYHDLLEAIPVEEATVEKVRHFFDVNGAAAAPALKGARLFIWLANQAGFTTAEVEYTPYKLDQDKAPAQKPKESKKAAKSADHSNGSRKSKQQESYVPKVTGDYEERLLNILLDKISTTDGLPSADILTQVRELIDIQEKKNKSRHAGNAPEPSARKENGDA